MPSENRNESPWGIDRERGILTSADRELLAGETELQPHSERAARQRVRTRIRDGLFDFAYLADPEFLDDRDLQQIIENQGGSGVLVADVFGAEEDEIGDDSREKTLDPHIEQALVEMVAFIFRVKPSPEYLERVLREGLRRGLDRVHPDGEVTDVCISISDPETISTKISQYIDQGVPLTEMEIRLALEEDVRPASEIKEYVKRHGTREGGELDLDGVSDTEWYGSPATRRDTQSIPDESVEKVAEALVAAFSENDSPAVGDIAHRLEWDFETAEAVVRDHNQDLAELLSASDQLNMSPTGIAIEYGKGAGARVHPIED